MLSILFRQLSLSTRYGANRVLEERKGILQKAEALYHQGEFEKALVLYHRGSKLRPTLPEFRLGIHKTQEAINNCVDGPQRVTLNTTGDLSFFEDRDESEKKKRVSSTVAPAGGVQPQKAGGKRKVVRGQAYNRAIQQLLRELYGDRRYLEKLHTQLDVDTHAGRLVCDAAEEGLHYLDTRTDFWHQQKPMYARRYEIMMLRKRFPNVKAVYDQIIIDELEKIDEAQTMGKYRDSMKRALKCLDTIETYTERQLTNKMAFKAQLYSCIGNAYLETGKYDKALANHLVDFNLGETCNMEEAMSRGLDNLGRVHARGGNFTQAIKLWEAKLPLSKTTLETTWLCHEIGRCYLELRLYTKAREYGQRSLEAAQQAGELSWQLHGRVLIAQAEVKLEEYESALSSFMKSLELSATLQDHSAEGAIRKAMLEVKAKLFALSKGQEANEITQAVEQESEHPSSQEPKCEITVSKPTESEHQTSQESKCEVTVPETSQHTSQQPSSEQAATEVEEPKAEAIP
ncbi:hypothetical protein C0Q70_04389 [Pomacea canaliculata]|uniref:Outer dynein arm-docking complex subunit 4 n=1 Tax=Pomacea canaliculata TaxID=400727 RepID=A0A2T7PVG6_POMCA|nr:hypothetical protein C0Q70_04389 [Pomacea canaliculata]